MKIHEYQGKELLRQFNVPVPNGIPAFSVDEAVKAAEKLGVDPDRVFKTLIANVDESFAVAIVPVIGARYCLCSYIYFTWLLSW